MTAFVILSENTVDVIFPRINSANAVTCVSDFENNSEDNS